MKNKTKKIKNIIPKHAKKVFHGERFHVYQWEQRLFNGEVATFEMIKRRDSLSAIIVEKDKIILIKEKQPHWLKEHLTLPAGGIEEGENIFEAVQREVEEEIGWSYKNYYLVYFEKRVIDIEKVHYVFIAKDPLKKVGQRLEPGEKIKPFKVSFDKFIDMVQNKKLYLKPTFVEEFLMRGEIKKLKDIFRHPEKYQITPPIFEE